MLNEVFGLRVDHLLWFFILRIELGVEYVICYYDADSIQDAIEGMDVVGHLSEVILHQEESEMSDCLGNNLQTTNSLLGQFIQTVIPKAFSVALS